MNNIIHRNLGKGNNQLNNVLKFSKDKSVLIYVKGSIDDFCNFLPLYDQIKIHNSSKNFKITSELDVDMSMIHPDFYLMSSKNPHRKLNSSFEEKYEKSFYFGFNFVFIVNSNIDNRLTIEQIANIEIGDNININFPKRSFKLKNEYSDIIGFNPFTKDQRYRQNTITTGTANNVWIDLYSFGFIPVDTYIDLNICKTENLKKMQTSIFVEESLESIINNSSTENNRYIIKSGNYNLSMREIYNKIIRMKYFIGIDNEFFKLVSYILGEEKCIMMTDSQLYKNYYENIHVIGIYDKSQLEDIFKTLINNEMKSLL